MYFFQITAVIIITAQICESQYTVSILLQEFDNGQGFLKNGSHCNPMWYANIQCDISLIICVQFPGNSTDGDLTTCSGALNNLSRITENKNEIKFNSYKAYGDWQNSMSFDNSTVNAVYQGFQLKVIATQGTDEIDEFLIIADEFGDKIFGELNYEHIRDNAPEPTRLKFSWVVEGNTSVPQPPGPLAKRTCANYIENITSDVYPIQLSDGRFVNVFCDIGRSSAYTVIQSRGFGDNFSFDGLTYEDYKISQGSPGWDANYWIGLENMYLLINSSNNFGMAIQLCCGQSDTDGIKLLYQNISMKGSSDNYAISGTSTSSAGKGMMFMGMDTDFGAQFATPSQWKRLDFPATICDVINTDAAGLSQSTGGWWFGSCGNNLNGHLYDPVADANLFDNSSRCLLKSNTGLPYGSGIEMRTSTTVPPGGYLIDWISYTRVRMALYSMDLGPPQDLQPFCRGPDPTTTP